MHRVDIDGWFRESISDDFGKTWTFPEKTTMWGCPAHLLYLKNGSLLCAYGYRRNPWGVRACLSYDRGKTWNIKKEIIIRCDAANYDLGYPKSIQLADGKIFTVYYFNRKDTLPFTFIAGSFYQIEKKVLN